MEIPMSEIGLCDKFLGSKTHFILPVQQSASESQKVIVDIDDDGRNVTKLCTIPERMREVFDSWGIKYDVESLEKAIEDTKKQLSNM